MRDECWEMLRCTIKMRYIDSLLCWHRWMMRCVVHYAKFGALEPSPEYTYCIFKIQGPPNKKTKKKIRESSRVKNAKFLKIHTKTLEYIRRKKIIECSYHVPINAVHFYS